MTDRELMQQALEALTTYDGMNGEGKRKRVLTALRERLAQPEQKPVGEMFLIDEATVELALEALHNVTEDYVENRQRTHNRAIEQLYKVFVPAPQRKPLTANDIEVAAADGYQKGWDAAMLRNSLGKA